MLRARILIITLAASGCAPGEASQASGTPGAAATSKSDNPLATASAEVTSAATSDATSASGAATTSQAEVGSDDTTGTCIKHVVLMGYWPPTNEMLRPWSQNPAQNPSGWVGENWRDHGYDVFAFFPEFPPDGDPTNDAIGDDGAVGSPDFDLRVDYQATSADFWRIVDEHQPVIVLTTSRGGDIGWEIEALEGGHGSKNPGDPSLDWRTDAHGSEQFPTQATIDPRSWDALTTHRQGSTLPTRLPVQEILAATTRLGVTEVVVDEGTSGDFLSGFLALHGLYYQRHAPHAVAAGHIHVGFGLPTADASALVEATLDAILRAHPVARTTCP